MPSAEQFHHHLLIKLKELFKLARPDMDYGFYRIMHAKAREIQAFIDKDLIAIVEDALGRVDKARVREARAANDKEVRLVGRGRATNPGKTKAALNEAKSDVYDHLYRFFERYYDNGELISRRRHTRETSGGAASFVTPRDGEDVRLHWANADQYFIKSAEYFTRFTFDPRETGEARASRDSDRLGSLSGNEDETPLTVRFRVVEAPEGAHGNLKVSRANKPFFIIHAEKPVELSGAGQLLINFEFRPDPEKSGLEKSWRDKRNNEAVEIALAHLRKMARTDKKRGKRLAEYLRLLKIPSPTKKDKTRPVLGRLLNRFTARNSMDYFIHKDLGGFLRRELDFYIKNEVMHLDDMENADAPTMENQLARIKALRNTAGNLIDFLARIEEFRKKLWLKKKIVVETNYCITLDRLPEELYPEIAANDAQHDEWVKLFAIDEIERELLHPGYEKPLTVAFLKANNKLPLDTRFFDEAFKARLIASIENIDDQCDGLLVHSENFQALNLLRERFRKRVKCVYIDPPYNTGGNGFAYKDSYRRSSWLTMMIDRLEGMIPFASNSAVFFASIDDNEAANIRILLDMALGADSFVSQIIIQSNRRGQTYRSIAKTHEYLMAYNLGSRAEIFELPKKTPTNALRDEKGVYELWELRNRNPKFGKRNRPNLYYPIYAAVDECNRDGHARVALNKTPVFNFEVLPKNSTGGDS
ncbi:MAG: site-specific DNA-methyltransferase, partial [Desulfobacterales bacterium]|nr:site-specific DNA-methyltransferase [Desulfobacterales bacterium]